MDRPAATVDALSSRLLDGLATVRQRTLALVAPLDSERLRSSPDPIMSPPLWDLGHIAAYEELWLVRRLTGRASLHPALEQVYDAFETPRAIRTDIPILQERAAFAYLEEVRARALEALERADLDRGGPPLTAEGFVFDMVAAHEAQHTETMLQALQMLPAGGYVPPERRPLPRPAEPIRPSRVAVPAGTFSMGAPAEGFAYDCERARHELGVAPFLVDRDPVTNGRHLEFMADGGYEREELWSPAGWEWRQANDVAAPLYWRADGDGWIVRSFEREEPVDPDLPVCHVSWYEAEAHARWAGGRLPTEAEWERAACHDAESPARYPWGDDSPRGRATLDQLSFRPAPVGAHPEGTAPSGCRGMVGDVWEWTGTAFTGYPGFRAFPYREYAEVFFANGYRVLRGGSWATQPAAASVTFRNWDLPQRRQIFAGFRCVWDL